MFKVTKYVCENVECKVGVDWYGQYQFGRNKEGASEEVWLIELKSGGLIADDLR